MATAGQIVLKNVEPIQAKIWNLVWTGLLLELKANFMNINTW